MNPRTAHSELKIPPRVDPSVLVLEGLGLLAFCYLLVNLLT